MPGPTPPPLTLKMAGLMAPSESSSWCCRQYLSTCLEWKSLGLGVLTVRFFFSWGWRMPAEGWGERERERKGRDGKERGGEGIQ